MEQADRLLGGRYALSDLLGYGGMAEVYRGTDVRLGRDVAVKVLRADLARDPSFLARFRREAQSAAGLSHPNIVSVYDTGEQTQADGTLVPFIVMEQVEGRTLRDVLKSEGKLVPRRAMEITAGVCAALEYSHGAGIIHRDIKPANVMITRGGDVKVMDFGIARAVAASQATMTQTAAVMGTAQYLSPEQARGEHVDARSDVYSTGCLLYELLTGQPPFSGDSPVAVAYQHVREDPVPPSQVDPQLGPEADAIVLKAMAKNPGNRYQSAGDFGADLERAASGRRVTATPVMPADATGRIPAVTTLAPAAALGGVTYLDEPRDRRTRRVIAYTVLALAVIGVFVGAALLVKGLLSTGASGGTAMPNVVSSTLTQAQTALSSRSLSVSTITNVYSDTQPANVVIKQDPTEGLLVTSQTRITLTVSLGIQKVQVPDVTGRQLDDATTQLTQNMLKVGQVNMVDDVTKPAGSIISTSPAAGATVDHDTSVSITVVSNLRTLPNTTGMTQAAATAALSNAGFAVKVQLQDDNGPPGMVLSQSPTDMTAQKGTQITIVVSQTPAPSPTPTPSPSDTPSDSPTPTSTVGTSPSASRSASATPTVTPT